MHVLGAGKARQQPPQREVLTREEMEGWKDIVPQVCTATNWLCLIRLKPVVVPSTS